MKNENTGKMNNELEGLKAGLENDLREIVCRAKARLVTSYSAVLGDEYVDAIARRQALSEKYKKYIGIAFECATKCDGIELVSKISALADDKNQVERDKMVKELLGRILELLEPDYYEIVSVVKNTASELEEVETRLDKMIDENRDEIAAIRQKIKNEFRTEIKQILSDFTEKAQKIKMTIKDDGGEKNAEAQEIKSANTELDIPDEDELDILGPDFIPFNKSKGTLN